MIKKGATSVAPFTFSPKTFGELKRRIYLCNKVAKILRLGIKNKRVYFVLLSTFRIFAAEKKIRRL
jgi:hypothetical protein